MSRRKSAPPGQRQLRVGEELRHALSAILAEDHLDDPDLKGRALTVTMVRVSPDLTNATAFVVPMFGQADASVPYTSGYQLWLRTAADVATPGTCP